MPTPENPALALAQEASSSLWMDAYRRLSKNKMALAGATFILIEAFICLITPWIAPYGFEQQNLEFTLARPSFAHWLGTDTLGRDLFTRVLYGGRVSLMVGILASLVSVVVGVIYGAVSGYAGGKIDSVLMRVVDILYALPFIFLVIILMVYFGRNIVLLFVALGLTEWLTMARIVRGQVISLKQKEFIEAAVSMGIPTRFIVLRHLVPNTLGPVIVYLTLTIPSAILSEAFLSFLGLGVQAPMASWGTLISSGVEVMEVAPWVLISPAIMLSLTLFSLNFLGDGLRDALDPKGAKD
ncbi:MAG: ABC transporter permease subunit [Deltaproteobacteria bacterium]|nr:ABC transporter permease subunit [Deltaproteobacteria bacterium]MBI3293481.1 ABC transporter permease subunit [Deltaproteobacteria bacterium]